MNVSKTDIINGLLDLGVKTNDEIEIHSSLSSLGYVVGLYEQEIKSNPYKLYGFFNLIN